jgi:hypothetical protein
MRTTENQMSNFDSFVHSNLPLTVQSTAYQTIHSGHCTALISRTLSASIEL